MPRVTTQLPSEFQVSARAHPAFAHTHTHAHLQAPPRVPRWYIENVEEELDAPNEFFHDVQNSRLLLILNGTGPPSDVEVPALTELVLLTGTQANPVTNVTFSGLTFTGQRPTYLEPHGHPSGGDWGLERLGAVRLAGTTSVTITDCLFHTVDGNAVFLDGFNRNATITLTEFVGVGASAIALWGYDDKGDGTSGDQPRFTTVTQTICHELGIYQKQVHSAHPHCFLGGRLL